MEMTDQEKVDKVLKGLEICKEESKLCLGECECGYQSYFPRCWITLASDAHELLESQRPRLMTLEEILSSDGAVWILDRDDKGCEIHIAFPLRKRGELDHVIEFRSRASDMREHRLIRDYLINWCCWTSRPTDEQRKAVKWND